MSTLAIPPKRVRLYRVLWDRWIIVLRILFDLGAGAHPVRWRAVADTLFVDKKTSQKYINGLVRDGHVAVAGDGYMLTKAGMAFLQEINEGEIPPLESGKNPGENFSPLVVEVVNESDSESRLTPPPPPKLGKNPGENFSPLAKAIIEHLPSIFDGSQLILTNLPWTLDEEFQDTLLLGWVAYAYDKRTSLSAPVGLIYSKLQRQDRPSIKYMEYYADYLPEAFLDAIGLWRKTCVVCEKEFYSRKGYDDHFQACLEMGRPYCDDVEPEHLSEPDKTITSEIQQAWESALQQLQADLPRAAFETWVQEALPVRQTEGVLHIAARNEYAQRWLTNRLTEKITSLVRMPVRFCVATETES
jgi:hypothetical protein